MDSEVWRCGPPRRIGRKQGFPARFWGYFKERYVSGECTKLLHLCSGDQTEGVTVDIDPSSGASIVADGRQLPFPSALFDISFADPPYSIGYAGEWPAEYPRPAHLLKEMHRVTKPGGLIAFFHLLVVPAPRGLGNTMFREAIHAILCGPHNAMRALNIFRRAGVGAIVDNV
jgi:SAM-dependent methyltransferase